MKARLTGLAMIALIAGGALPVQAAHTPAQSKAAVAKGLADPARADQAVDDSRRKAAEVLAFSGVGAGDTVVDFLPGGKFYWTRIFSGAVGPKGKVYARWPAAAAEGAAKAQPTLDAWKLANVSNTVASAPPSEAIADGSVDLVWTVQNYHDLANKGGEAALLTVNRDVRKMLKPGGIYVVIDHADAAGSGITGTSTTHRIDPAAVKAQVIAAGFTFVGESKVLANPADDHKAKVFDPAIRGHTDQFVYKFRKPG